jgi:hypothetical protein
MSGNRGRVAKPANQQIIVAETMLGVLSLPATY